MKTEIKIKLKYHLPETTQGYAQWSLCPVLKVWISIKCFQLQKLKQQNSNFIEQIKSQILFKSIFFLLKVRKCTFDIIKPENDFSHLINLVDYLNFSCGQLIAAFLQERRKGYIFIEIKCKRPH